MKDKRKKDRRKKCVKPAANRRKGPRRLTCDCGGKIEVIIKKKGGDTFTCARCGKKH